MPMSTAAGKQINKVANYKPVSECGMEELAARQRTLKRPSGGILFARNADGEEKTAVRQKVLELFHPDKWDRPLHMLTMPSLQWRFERLLLAAREEGWLQHAMPRRTLFTGVENDRSIYFAAIAQMPGIHTPDHLIKRERKFVFAEQAVRTKYATLVFANVEDLMQHEWNGVEWDAAWLDYTGPLTAERMDLIASFYKRYISEILIVTALKARWDTNTSEEISNAQGYFAWLRKRLPGEVLHELEYFDTSPMAQFAVRKTELAIAETKIKFVQRDHGNTTMLTATHFPGIKRIEEQFGGLPVIEAKDPLRLQPIKSDVIGAVTKDPCNCVFARCAIRQFGATRVFFWKSVAYVDLVGKDGIRRIERFIIKPAVRELIEKFDRGEPIEEGRAFILSPPPTRLTRKHLSERWQVYAKTPLGRAKTRFQTVKGNLKAIQKTLKRTESELTTLKCKKGANKEQLRKLINRIEAIKLIERRALDRVAAARAEFTKVGGKKYQSSLRTRPRIFDVRSGQGLHRLVTST